jgi:hypothetical protein
MEGEMKIAKWMGVAAAIACTAPPAQAATTDPLMVLYVWSGAKDDGGATNVGVASSIHCSSFSNVSETLQWLVKDNFGGVKANVTLNVTIGQTLTASTHGTTAYSESLFLNTGTLAQGSMAVLATSTSIFCTAQVLDASLSVPTGMSLHGIRFNPIPGTSE